MKKELFKLTKKELLKLADQSNIKVSKRMTNSELVDILMKNKDKFIPENHEEVTKGYTLGLEGVKKETLITMLEDLKNDFYQLVAESNTLENRLLTALNKGADIKKQNIDLAESKANYKIFLILSILANVLLLIPFI